MQADEDTRSQVIAALARLCALATAQDPALRSEFAGDADVLVLGSEAGELAEGQEGLDAFVRGLSRSATRYSWRWRRQAVSCAGDIAWLYADGEVTAHEVSGEERRPYRLTGVLERIEGSWLWRQFHGSEPWQPR